MEGLLLLLQVHLMYSEDNWQGQFTATTNSWFEFNLIHDSSVMPDGTYTITIIDYETQEVIVKRDFTIGEE